MSKREHGTVTYVRFSDDQREWLTAEAKANQRSIAGQVRYVVDLARASVDERKAA